MVKFVDVLAAVIAIACFTPLVIPIAQSTPSLLGVPYTMWVGFLASMLLVGLTAVIAVIKNKEKDGQ